MLIEKRIPGFSWQCQEPCLPSQRTASPAAQPVRREAQGWGFPTETDFGVQMALPLHVCVCARTHTYTHLSTWGHSAVMPPGFDGLGALEEEWQLSFMCVGPSSEACF